MKLIAIYARPKEEKDKCLDLVADELTEDQAVQKIRELMAAGQEVFPTYSLKKPKEENKHAAV